MNSSNNILLFKKQGKYFPYWHAAYDLCWTCKNSTKNKTEIICMRHPTEKTYFGDIRWFFCDESCFNIFVLDHNDIIFKERNWAGL